MGVSASASPAPNVGSTSSKALGAKKWRRYCSVFLKTVRCPSLPVHAPLARPNTSGSNIMDALPSEIMFYILSFVNPEDVGQFSSVCRHSNQLATDNTLWRMFLRKYWALPALATTDTDLRRVFLDLAVFAAQFNENSQQAIAHATKSAGEYIPNHSTPVELAAKLVCASSAVVIDRKAIGRCFGDNTEFAEHYLRHMDAASLISEPDAAHFDLIDNQIAAFKASHRKFIEDYGLLKYPKNISHTITLFHRLWGVIVCDGNSALIGNQDELSTKPNVKLNSVKIVEMFNRGEVMPALSEFVKLGYLPAESLSDQANERLAMFFRTHAGVLDRRVISRWLLSGGAGAMSSEAPERLVAYLSTFDMVGMSPLDALRVVLAELRIPGEESGISRVFEKVASEFTRQNPVPSGLESSPMERRKTWTADSVYVMFFAAMMLNTDQHNPIVRHKMTLDQFVSSNAEAQASIEPERADNTQTTTLLEKMYKSIVAYPITRIE